MGCILHPEQFMAVYLDCLHDNPNHDSDVTVNAEKKGIQIWSLHRVKEMMNPV